jgi:hypothetical protein
MLPTIVRPPRAAADIALGIKLAKMQDRPIGPDDVARVLVHAGVKYVIVGAHAINGYSGRPRATVDVDVIAQHPKKAARAIGAAFPHLKMQDTPVVIRFKDEDHEAIDVMKPAGSSLWPRLLKDAVELRIGRMTLRVPRLEGVLAAKFSSMCSPLRRVPDRQQDAADFIRVVEANAKINLEVLEELGELVYTGGGGNLLKLVADAGGAKTRYLTGVYFPRLQSFCLSGR